MDYTCITNPKTHRKVDVQSNKGISIVAGYLNRLAQKERQALLDTPKTNSRKKQCSSPGTE
jgi:hypothetical protein